MIIVEGPDGAGKSTLIKRLQARTGLEVAPRVVSKDAEAMVDLRAWTEENVANGFQNMIFDRHRLISEPIYGPVLREKPEPGFDNLVWFHQQLKAFYDLKPIVIWCLPPLSVVWGNVMSDDDNRIFHHDGRKLIAVYGAYVNKALTEHVLYGSSWVYDYTDPVLSTPFVGMITDHIKKRIDNVREA